MASIIFFILSFSPMPNRLKNSFFGRPTQFANAIRNYLVIYPNFFSPLAKIECAFANSDRVIRSCVVGLFHRKSPFYITREIAFVIINSFNRVFRSRLWTDIIKKGLERFYPFRINFNASSSVVFVFFVFRIVATGFHFVPCIKFGRIRHAMFEISFLQKHFLNTTTRFCITAFEIVTLCNNKISAFTLALPPCIFPFAIRDTFKNSKPTKVFSGKINKSHNNLQAKVTSIMRNAAGRCLGSAFRALPYPLLNNTTKSMGLQLI